MKTVIRPVISLRARGPNASSKTVGRYGTQNNVGLLGSKQRSREDFRQRELSRQVKLRQKLERAKNAGVDPVASSAIDMKTKQVENTIGLLQRKKDI